MGWVDGGVCRRSNGAWENITTHRPDRESEGAIVVKKRGNARGAKGPCRKHVSARGKEIRLNDQRSTTENSTPDDVVLRSPDPMEVKHGVKLPMTVSELRRKLGQKAKQEVNDLSGRRKGSRSTLTCKPWACNHSGRDIVDHLRMSATEGFRGSRMRENCQSGLMRE